MNKIVEYTDLPQEQKDTRSKLWVQVLNTYCHADHIGNRPCDYGCPCDRCHYDPILQLKYIELIRDRGLTLTTKELNSLKEGLGDE
jgi:hypothetical protein